MPQEGNLRRAIARGEFEPVFQPIYDLASQRVVGYEALLRWRHPQRGLLLPADFLSQAEDSGLAESIDWLVYELVFAQAHSLLEDGRYVSINVGARHFRSLQFVPSLLALLARYDLEPRQLRIEVTERTLLEEPTLVRELLDQMAYMLGGRAAEELIFHDPTTGAQNDIEKATKIARAMVTEFGMADAVGPQQLGSSNGEPFLGREMGSERNYSDDVAAVVDAEVRALIDHAHSEAREILEQHRVTLDRLADALVERETLDTPELMELFADLPVWTGPALGGNGSTNGAAAGPAPDAGGSVSGSGRS